MTLLIRIAAAAFVVGAAVLVWLLLPARTAVDVPSGVSSRNVGMVERGTYVVRIAGCVTCHTAKGGVPFAGGRALETPFGTFHAPNITPHKTAGIGAWTDEQFLRAVMEGEGIHGEQLYPVFPYTSYSRMTPEDVLSIKAYLFSLAPADLRAPANELSFPYSWRALMKAWKVLFFDGAQPLEEDPSRSKAWNRGRYLVVAPGHCGECHTPRNFLGAPDQDSALRGNSDGPDGWAVPALVGPSKGSFAQWSVEEISEYLKTGGKPDFDSSQGPMKEVIEENTRFLTDEDRAAMAEFLKSLNE
jgi:mono/diheme cytochrome c family protein